MRRGAGIAGEGVTGCFRRQFKALQGSRRRWANTHARNNWAGRDPFEREWGRAKAAAQVGEATESGKSQIAVCELAGRIADACHSRLVADLRRPALGTARPEAATQDEVLIVSKVASSSCDGAPGIGQERNFADACFVVACCYRDASGSSYP